MLRYLASFNDICIEWSLKSSLHSPLSILFIPSFSIMTSDDESIFRIIVLLAREWLLASRVIIGIELCFWQSGTCRVVANSGYKHSKSRTSDATRGEPRTWLGSFPTSGSWLGSLSSLPTLKDFFIWDILLLCDWSLVSAKVEWKCIRKHGIGW